MNAADFDYIALNLGEERPGLPWRREETRMPVLLDGMQEGKDMEWRNELQAWQKRIYRQFYFRPERLLRELGSRVSAFDFGDGKNIVKDVVGWIR
jgi:hypothetical protein